MWTPDQRAAIESRDVNLLVSAAAGSGKTTVLVERVVSLVAEGHDIEGFLIVTFTRAAAADMRAKLVKGLTQAAEADPRLREQAERAERAHIGTLHSFCTDLLRLQFQAAGIDPGFRVLDEIEGRQLLAKSLEQVLEEGYQQPDAGFEALAARRKPEELAQLLETVYRFILARPDPFQWLEQALQALEGDGQPWFEQLALSAHHETGHAQALLHQAASLCALPGGPFHYEGALREDLRALEDWDGLDYRALRQALGAFKLTRPGRAGKTPVDAQLTELAKSLRAQAKKLLEGALKLLEIEPEQGLKDAAALKAPLGALARLVEALNRAFARRKAERNALDFNDLEHRALQALADDQVAQSVRDQFEFVFVDEYQDTSDVQEAILGRVCRANNLFMVGDVKQSIYRFREAEPRLFLEKYHQYGQGQGGRLIVLGQNFRSRSSVLAFTNRVFERVMHRDTAEIEYDQAARLVPGARYPEPHPPVELTLLARKNLPGQPPDEPFEEEEEALLEELKQAEREGLVIARRIRQLLSETRYDPQTGGEVPIQPRDIAVLMRNAKGVMPQVMQILLNEGIPAYAETATGFFDVLEVQLALALLELVDNSRRDVALLSVLRSPMVGLTSEQLAQVRAFTPRGAYCDAARAYAGQAEDALAECLRAFFSRLALWQRQARMLPLAQLIDQLMQDTGYLGYVGALPGGAQRQANLSILCTRAQAFEDSQAGGLSEFLSYIRGLKRIGSDLGEAHRLGEGDNVVRLMTIHKSKGLEFPVVIGCMLGASLKRPGSAPVLLTHRRLGLGMLLTDSELGTRRRTLPLAAIEACRAQESRAEELRILYVLLTRAKERLILMGSVADAASTALTARIAAERPLPVDSYLTALAPAMVALPGGDALLAPLGSGFAPLPCVPGPQVVVHYLDAARLNAPGQPLTEAPDLLALSSEPEAPSDPAMAQAMAWQYPYAGATLLPLKLTASGLQRQLEGPRQLPEMARRPRFLEDRQGLNAAEQGTAIHAALQGLDLEALRPLEAQALEAALTEQLDALAARGVLTPTMRDAVSGGCLARFFQGELGRRMLHARELHREWAFNLRMRVQEALGGDSQERLLVQGVIDCCFMEGDGWVLIDYKTDRADDAALLLDRYRPQLALYQRALEEITARPVRETYLCLLRSGQTIPVA